MTAWAEHTDHKALLRQVLPSIGQWRHEAICLHLGSANADVLSASIPHLNWHRLEIYTVSSHQQNSACHCVSFHLKNWFKLQLQQETCWYTSANKKAYSIINKLQNWAPVWLLLHIHSALTALCFFFPQLLQFQFVFHDTEWLLFPSLLFAKQLLECNSLGWQSYTEVAYWHSKKLLIWQSAQTSCFFMFTCGNIKLFYHKKNPFFTISSFLWSSNFEFSPRLPYAVEPLASPIFFYHLHNLQCYLSALKLLYLPRELWTFKKTNGEEWQDCNLIVKKTQGNYYYWHVTSLIRSGLSTENLANTQPLLFPTQTLAALRSLVNGFQFDTKRADVQSVLSHSK